MPRTFYYTPIKNFVKFLYEMSTFVTVACILPPIQWVSQMYLILDSQEFCPCQNLILLKVK